jgi:signal transduction histidine kinase
VTTAAAALGRPHAPPSRPQGEGGTLPWPPVRPGRHLLLSAGFRFAAIYALLLAVSAAALAMFLWWSTAGLLDRQSEAAIQADMESLASRFNAGGLTALVLTIEERLSQDVEDEAIYLLVDASGLPIAGNLQRWPQGAAENGGLYELPIERAGMRSLAMVQSFDLPNRYRLLIGRDIHVRAQLRALLTDALLWAMLVVLAMASAGALVVRSLFRHALANVSATAGAIAAGDFTQRVKLSGRGDEFDQLAETINDMLDRMARLMEGVREVSNAIAHDLRTPITRARARLEDASVHAGTVPEQRAAIERAITDLDGIVAVFQALLRIAEIEAGSRRAAFAKVDLAPLLTGVAELYGAVAEERGITLSVRAPDSLPIHGDRELIQQAVANMVDNAVKFSPQGGSVTLSATLTAASIEIAVADQGPGIPEADRQRAGERFFRGESARNTPGSGLGLALVQAVAQLHGGSLRLADAAPGLEAILSLPRHEEAG